MSVVELGKFFAEDGMFGVNSASLMNFILCLVSVRTNGCVKVSTVLMFLLNSCCLFWFFIYCCFDFVSLASLLVVFSQWSIPVILLRSHFHCKRLQSVTLW